MRPVRPSCAGFPETRSQRSRATRTGILGALQITYFLLHRAGGSGTQALLCVSRGGKWCPGHALVPRLP